MPSWIQDPKTGKLIPRHEYQSEQETSHFVSAFTEFVSPIDGSTIANRDQLAEHNRRHGVTNIRDYGENYFENKAKERRQTLRGDSPAAKRERINTILDAMARSEGR